MYNRAFSSTHSSLPSVFHSTIQGSENFLELFRCLESCLTALCSWETRASTSQVTSLPKTHCQIECRIRLPRDDRVHRSSPPCRDLVAKRFLGTISFPHLRNTATRSRCSTRHATHEVSALLTNVKNSKYEARTSLKIDCVLHRTTRKRPTRRVSRVRASRLALF